MKILSIETSCDETAVAILDCAGDDTSANFHVLSHALISQIEIHREFGGVYPAVAKREHAKNLVPLLQGALEEAEMLRENLQTQVLTDETRTVIGTLLAREADMAESFLAFIDETERPEIDAIAVTYGPGLEPALWVGVNFAQALSLAWNMLLVPVNHMEGHLMVSLAKPTESSEPESCLADGTHLTISDVALPTLALLISGGHTEIDLMESWLTYKLLGQTRDDAVGEAFDKVARMMDLPYPGGPEISVLAEKAREDTSNLTGASSDPAYSFILPRPMIDTPDFDFSFSGLKTAVLYTIRDTPALQPAPEGSIVDTRPKEELAQAFEDAAADVLVAKVSSALEDTQAQTLAIGGGVSANQHIRSRFEEQIARKFPYVDLRFPPAGLTGDNAIMIGLAGYYHYLRKEFAEPGTLIANGNLSLSIKVS